MTARCGAIAANGYSRCAYKEGHAGDHEVNERPGRHAKWPQDPDPEQEASMNQVIVVRRVSDGAWATSTVATDDPFEAMRWIREQGGHLAGAEGELHAFKIENTDGSPVFVPVGILESLLTGPEF